MIWCSCGKTLMDEEFTCLLRRSSTNWTGVLSKANSNTIRDTTQNVCYALHISVTMFMFQNNYNLLLEKVIIHMILERS